jgi:hypothetical protein
MYENTIVSNFIKDFMEVTQGKKLLEYLNNNKENISLQYKISTNLYKLENVIEKEKKWNSIKGDYVSNGKVNLIDTELVLDKSKQTGGNYYEKYLSLKNELQ